MPCPGLRLAGFHLSITGRFWASTEVRPFSTSQRCDFETPSFLAHSSCESSSPFVIVYTMRDAGEVLRITGARRASRRERKRYEEARGVSV